jgi:hypothetical protein
MRILIEIAVASVAVVAGIVVTRARFGHKFRRTPPDDRGELTGVTADLPRDPRPRHGSASVEEPDDER